MFMRGPRSVPFRQPFRSMRSALCGVGLGAAIFLTASAASPDRARASIVLALDLPDLVKQADHIALVDVVSQHADWDTKHQRIISSIEVSVVERWKGASATTAGVTGDRMTILQPGGTVGDLTMTVTGLSTFRAGERALVFLRGDATAAHVVGMSQGKRRVHFEASTNRWLVHAPDLNQATLVKPRVATPASGEAAGSLQRVVPPARDTALEDFRAQVKALLGTSTR